MIFDNTKQTELLISYRESKDNKKLTELMQGCDKLIEVIVSRFDNQYRDDLIQECRLKILLKLDSFNPGKGKLHSFLSTVLNNHCITYIAKNSRVYNPEMELEHVHTTSLLAVEDVIAHNLERFSGVNDKEEVEVITRYIFESLIDGIYGKSRGIIGYLTETHNLSRSMATVIYNSTIVYMRKKLLNNRDNDVIEPYEFSLLYDFRELVGDVQYELISKLFSGMYLKFP